MTRGSIDSAVARLAVGQYGVFARAQLADLGVTRGVISRRVGAGRWERVAPSVYRLAGNPQSWRQALMIACLAWGNGTAVSHHSAAAVWRMAGFEPGLVELTVAVHRRGGGPGIIHRNALRPTDIVVVAALPVTSPARTLIDLASSSESDVVEEALDDALRRRLVTISGMRRHLDRYTHGRPGVRMMRRLIDQRSAISIPQSVFETRLLRLIRRSHLPPPALQHAIRDARGLVAVVDFAYPELKLAIEADGYRWHSSRLRWQSDMARHNRLTALGWRLIHLTWNDVMQQPERISSELQRLISCPP